MDERSGPGEVVDEGHQRARQGPDGGDAADWIVSVCAPHSRRQVSSLPVFSKYIVLVQISENLNQGGR